MAQTSATLLEKVRDPADVVAWQRLMLVYEPLLFAWMRRHALQPTDAEDLVQEVLTVVFQELPRFRHTGRPGAFRCWLRTILMNRLRVFWRDRRSTPVATGDSGFLAALDQEVGPGDMDEEWDRDHDRYVLGRLLELVRSDFEPATWEAFQLIVSDGLKPSQAAARLGVSVDTVYTAKCRILHRLRQELQTLPD